MERNVFFIIICLTELVFTTTCRHVRTAPAEKVETRTVSVNDNYPVSALPYRDSTGVRVWGLVGLDGEEIVSARYAEEPSPVVGGLFTVREHGVWHYYAAEATPRRVGEGYAETGLFWADIAPCRMMGDNHYYFIRKNATVAKDITFVDGKAVEEIDRFYDGYARYRAGGLYGFADAKGRIVQKPVYDIASRFSEGYAFVGRGDSIFTIDAAGKTGSLMWRRIGITSIGVFHQGVASRTFFLRDGKERSDSDSLASEFVDFSGKTIIPADTRYKKVSGMWDTHFAFFNGQAWGIADNQLTVLIDPNLDSVLYLGSRAAAVKLNGVYKLIDYTGRVISPNYVSMTVVPTADPRFICGDDTGMVLINDKGEQLGPKRYRITFSFGREAPFMP